MASTWIIYGLSMEYLWIWLVVEKTHLKNMKVHWDDENSQYMEKIQVVFQTTNQVSKPYRVLELLFRSI